MTVIAQDDHLTAGAWAACVSPWQIWRENKSIERNAISVAENLPLENWTIFITFPRVLQLKQIIILFSQDSWPYFHAWQVSIEINFLGKSFWH